MAIVMNYKKRIRYYTFISFLGFTILIIFLQFRRETEYKENLLKSNLSTYIDIIDKTGLKKIDELNLLLPKGLRVTVINDKGEVVYDNAIDSDIELENHITRPELIAANKSGEGSCIRVSTTTLIDYYYYAKKFDKYFIRVALPNNIELKRHLRTDIYFIYFVIVIFICALCIIFYIANKLDHTVTLLRNFVSSIEQGRHTDKELAFMENEIGDVGSKIVKTYTLLDKRNKELATERGKMQQMTSNIAHELRTPVSSISGYLETLINQSERLTQEKKVHYLNRAYLQTNRLTELIKDISLITKIESAKESLPTVYIDINKLLSEMVEDYCKKTENLSIDLKINEKISLNGNINLVYSIFSNLIDNSIKYGANSKGEVQITIEYYQKNSTHYFFRVSDTGKGVDNEYLPRIFDRFYRIDKGRTRQHSSDGGSGLGLSIVKNGILFHNGTISASSNNGIGIMFEFSLSFI